MSGFLIASMMCGTADMLEEMVVFRFLQGCAVRRWYHCRR
jgi:hypothetical protein